MKPAIKARLAALEKAAQQRAAHPDAVAELWKWLEALAQRGCRDRPLARMSAAEQAAYVLFNTEATHEEAEEVAARLEACSYPIDAMGKLIREVLVTLNRNEGRAVIGLPLLETKPNNCTD